MALRQRLKLDGRYNNYGMLQCNRLKWYVDDLKHDWMWLKITWKEIPS